MWCWERNESLLAVSAAVVLSFFSSDTVTSSPSLRVDLARYAQSNFTATSRFLANVSSQFPIRTMEISSRRTPPESASIRADSMAAWLSER